MTIEAPEHRARSSRTMEVLRGEAVASQLLSDIRRGRASSDALLEAIDAARSDERRRGLCAALQKALTRGLGS